MPNEIGFDSNYFLQVITGDKKVRDIQYNVQLLPLGHHNDFNLRYFRKDHILTKEFLIGIISKDPNYKIYMPDNIELKTLSHDYLLSVSL